MRIVLNAIYEPEFARENTHFGFRPKYGCADSIQRLKISAKSMDPAIEGDVKGAFDNVNHDLLKNREKIKDQKFLKRIYGGLKCGIIYLKYREFPEIGTTHGSVVSSLLYNVYFNEFDKFINGKFTRMVDKINEDERRTDKPINKLYNSISLRRNLC